MTTQAERQALDVQYPAGTATYELAGSATAVVAAIPTSWLGRYVDFCFVDTTATTNVCYILFGSANTVAASISPTVSAIDGTTKAMTAIVAATGSQIRLLHGQCKPVRIPDSGTTYFSHIEGAATGRLRMTVSCP